ncbi:hypothetical protein CHARACLAT_027503 [Characodon lateralis]|uniref:Uncharacterized protein n=1 Tax=Characodon lateralis TaxID=208331 RepID=A0ABU7EDJ2_9TELE|nr:hypothetical protein [Characodon lateralis]
MSNQRRRPPLPYLDKLIMGCSICNALPRGASSIKPGGEAPAWLCSLNLKRPRVLGLHSRGPAALWKVDISFISFP